MWRCFLSSFFFLAGGFLELYEISFPSPSTPVLRSGVELSFLLASILKPFLSSGAMCVLQSDVYLRAFTFPHREIFPPFDDSARLLTLAVPVSELFLPEFAPSGPPLQNLS